ncbi:acyltransferase family protein [Mucilaginibacter sp. X5P1]|uniref:acyltransferase family protein n=1 Tax=Mucilaginibacter sp. X5P1 TaxID=2723088 RepID=UPI001609EB3A|nr:acyltransferase [Mucilaginibacter sp. X5P1]MBB6137218.1 peptidoglycan/LPS O-acetylase OafA/YrhL [Mucilaginibacter sp. X5P1]
MKYNPQLDSMRALAALAIIAYHYLLFPAGWIGVQFFFVLSGFLISGIILNGKRQYKAQGMLTFFKVFYNRRMRRLLPLYFGYLGLLGIFYLFTKKPEAINSEWLWLLTYTLNFRWLFDSYTFHMVYGHLWSLALEWQFYLVWPVFLWKLPEKYFLKVMLSLIFVAMFIRIMEYVVCNHITFLVGYNGTPAKEALAPYVLPFSHLDAFVFGALLCDRRFRHFLCKPLIAYLCISVTLVAGLILVMAIPTYPLASLGWPTNLPSAFQWVWGYSLLNLTSAALIANLIKRKDARLFSFTKLKLFQHLGKISYGIYVYHPIIIFLTLGINAKLHPFPGNKILELLIVMALTSLAAHFSYELWEKRFLKKKKVIKTTVKPEPEIVYN